MGVQTKALLHTPACLPRNPPSLQRVQLMSLRLRSVDPAMQARQTVAPVVRRVSRPGAHSEQELLVKVDGRKNRGGQASSRTAPAAVPPVCPVAVVVRPVTKPPGAIWHPMEPARAEKGPGGEVH